MTMAGKMSHVIPSRSEVLTGVEGQTICIRTILVLVDDWLGQNILLSYWFNSMNPTVSVKPFNMRILVVPSYHI